MSAPTPTPNTSAPSRPRLRPAPLEQPAGTSRAIASLEAEQAVIGAGLLEDAAVDRARGIVRPDDFAWDAHGELFAAMLALRDREIAIDPLTLSDELDRRGTLAAVGGKAYIGYLLDAVPSTANVEFHARLLLDRARRRRLQDLAYHLADAAGDPETDLQLLAQEASGALLPLAADTEAAARGGFQPVRDTLWAVMEQIEARGRAAQDGQSLGVATGIPELDELIPGGLRPAEFAVFAARPKSAKSTLVGQIALNNVMGWAGPRPRAVGIVSVEMTRQELTEGFLANLARVDRSRIDAGRLRDDDWPKLARASGLLSPAPLYIADDAFPSLPDVVARCTRLKAEHPEIELIAVDYLQRVTNPLKGRRGDEEVNAVSAGLKQLGKRLGVPVIAPAQVNFKETDRDQYRKPEARDVQNCSGAVQDANFFFVLHRDRMTPQWLEVYLDECRRRAPGKCTLGLDGAHMRVFSPREATRSEPPPPRGAPRRDWSEDVVGERESA